MKKIPLTPKREPTSALCDYIREAFNYAKSIKACKEKHFSQVDNYLKHKGDCDEAIVRLCEGKDSPTVKINMDAVSNYVDTWVAVGKDAIIQAEKPWEISSTKIPTIPENIKPEIVSSIKTLIGQVAAQQSGGDPALYQRALVGVLNDENGSYDQIREARDEIHALIKKEQNERAQETANVFDCLIQDDMEESNWDEELDSFFYSFGLEDYAVLKTPEFMVGYEEEVNNLKVQEVQKLTLKHEHIDSRNYYTSSDRTWSDHGTFELDISSISLNELKEAKNYDGFLSKQIDRVIEFFENSNREWLDEKWDCTTHADKWKGYEDIEVIKYHGKIEGDVIFDWISADNKKKFKGGFDKSCSHEAVVWKIHDFIVYGSVQLSKRVRRPYRVASYSKRGKHVYDGRGLFSILFPYQDQMDAYWTMMRENANLSAGGIIGYNRNKIDAEEFSPEQIRGGARIPVKSSVTDGGNDRPIFEIRFDSHVSEFFQVILQLEQQMERKSQLPASSLGFGGSGSFRSTGIASIVQANANKAVLHKILEIEKQVVKPTIKDLVSYHLWNTDDKRILNGAVDVKVSGYSEIIRNQDRQQNLDLFMQNIVGYMNARLALQQQGQDVSGLDSLLGRYAEQAGFDKSVIFGENQAVEGIANQLVSNQPVETSLQGLDGRSQPPVNIESRI